MHSFLFKTARILRPPVQQRDIIAESAQDEVTDQLEIMNDIYAAGIPQNNVYETISLPEEHDEEDYVVINH